MKKQILSLLGTLSICTGIAGTADAHHSHAMFDMTVEKSITGTIKALAFTNPHVYMYVDVKDDSTGAVTPFVVEMSHVQNMISRGVTPSVFKPGDPVTVNMNPLKDGRPGGSYTTVTDKDGKKYE